jgi:glycosyltransferase 2 family protein
MNIRCTHVLPRKALWQILRSAAAVLAVGVCIFFIARRVHLTPPHALKAIVHGGIWYFTGACALCVVVLVIEWTIWHALVRGSSDGAKLSWRTTLFVYMTSALAKYVPGRVWAVTAQWYLLARYRVTLRVAARLTILTTVASIVSAALIGATVFVLLGRSSPWHLITFLALGLGAVVVPPRAIGPLSRRWARVSSGTGGETFVSTKRWAILLALYCLVWILHGCTGVLLAMGLLSPLNISMITQIIGTMAGGWLAGALAVIVPAGLGVRETTMMALLTSFPAGIEVTVPIMSRLAMIAADISAAAVAMVIIGSRDGWNFTQSE